MRSKCIKRIEDAVRSHPERWKEVLELALLEGEFSSEEELFLNSALAIHNNYSPDLEVAESVLAGDAFIPLAIESLLDSNRTRSEIDSFLLKAVKKLDASG